MDEEHLASAVRYVSLNPVRAGLAARAEDWAFSSVRAHLANRNDSLVNVRPVLDRFPDFSTLIAAPPGIREFEALRRAETTGRPLGPPVWVERLGGRLGRSFALGKPGPKRRATRGT